MKKLKLNKKKLIGLTGGFSTGKSTVARILRSYGDRVIDADRISHGLLKPGSKIYKKVIRLFGKRIVTERGNIDRRKLSGIVFGDKRKLSRFNKIMHPEILQRIQEAVKGAGSGIVVVDAPLLMETGLNKSVDLVVVVKASKKNQLERARKRTGLSRPQIIARIRAQMPLKEKLRNADFVIDNNGTVSDTRKQVALIRRLWWRS